jgi:hypothetical protein
MKIAAFFRELPECFSTFFYPPLSYLIFIRVRKQ